jgi:TetR/AcrR family transcriptional repressor of nem operon
MARHDHPRISSPTSSTSPRDRKTDSGFSFRNLADEIGIKSASVHHHFPTKAKMAAAVARRYGERFLASVVRKPNETAADAIAVYRSAFRGALERDERMCLCGVLGAEAGVLAPEVITEVQSFFRGCIEDLARRIGSPDATARAYHVMATLNGGMMVSCAYGDIDAFRSVDADTTGGLTVRLSAEISMLAAHTNVVSTYEG